MVQPTNSWANGGPGSYAPGFSPRDEQYHNSHIGEQYVFSGYWGKPVYASELPPYEAAAYGFLQTGPSQSTGNNQNEQYKKDFANYQAGYTHTPPNPNDPKYSMPGGMGGYSGTSSYATGQNNPLDYANAASNAIAQMYKRIRERSATGVNTDLAKRGIFSSGVAGGIMGEKMHELDLNETADIAKLYQQGGAGEAGGAGGNPRQGGPGPWNMGGFGSSLPGFWATPGSGPVDQSAGYPQIKNEARATQKANGNNSGAVFGGFGKGGLTGGQWG